MSEKIYRVMRWLELPNGDKGWIWCLQTKDLSWVDDKIARLQKENIACYVISKDVGENHDWA
jgi:hypothetical protein